jgi:hypothetical protein
LDGLSDRDKKRPFFLLGGGARGVLIFAERGSRRPVDLPTQLPGRLGAILRQLGLARPTVLGD